MLKYNQSDCVPSDHEKSKCAYILVCHDVEKLCSDRFFDVAKFTCLTPLSFQILCKLFAMVDLKCLHV